jgi:hypothetical protein
MAIAMQQSSSVINERTRDLLEQLKDGVTNLVSSERWLEYLRFQSRFHRYSANNALLIMIQRPDAVRVAGFQTWKSMGRYVKRGEKGIAIFAPLTRKMKTTDIDGNEFTFSRLCGFKVVYTFDIAQTDGASLPEAPIKLLDMTGVEGLTQSVLGIADKLGVTVQFGDAGGSNGYFERDTRRIVIESGNPPAQQLKTLVHEYAHSILHAQWQPDVPREQKEVEAESAAYVVCNYFSLDSADYSLAYVAGWSGSDPEEILHYAARIQQAATTIIDLIQQG